MRNFTQILASHNVKLTRSETEILQVNMGLLCNQVCTHCHLDAGPKRSEVMDENTVSQVIEYIKRGKFHTVDITGGAPEMAPSFVKLLREASNVASRTIYRSNLSALNDGTRNDLFYLLKERSIEIIASFPSFNKNQFESQRGKDIYDPSIDALKKLNEIGYGKQGSNLILNLVSNPAGAFLPQKQEDAEKRLKKQVYDRFSIEFNNLFTFANVPLGRFRKWLERSGNYESYLQKLQDNFNPSAVDSLMCRNTVSVSWDGYLYDCDFNIAANLPLGDPMGDKKIHVSEMDSKPESGSPITIADHCFTCTAGAGFT